MNYIAKRIIIAAMSAVMVAGLWGCGSEPAPAQPQNVNQNAVKGTYQAEIDISKDNSQNRPSKEAVVSGGKVQESKAGFEGDIAKAVMIVNGEPVDPGIMQFALNNSAMSYAKSLMYVGLMEDPNNFDWSADDPNYDGTYMDYVKDGTLDELARRYAFVGEGKRNGIVLTDEDKASVQNFIKEQQGAYSDADFEAILQQNGCPSIGAMVATRELNILESKIYEDFSANPEKYMTKEQLAALDDGTKVTVKHILVAFNPDDPSSSATDEMKTAAKAEAEEALTKVKAGEDFDALIKEYNDDPGATDAGYTFADDGTMVPEFSEASFALQVGQTSELVETTYGYHIIKRIERAATVEDYIKLLSENTKVTINESVFSNLKVTADLELYLNTVIQSMMG